MTLAIGVAGASGRLGQRLIQLLKKDDKTQFNCGLVSAQSKLKNNDVDSLISHQCLMSDIWIDFSSPAAFEKVLNHCVETKTPLVTGTTGLSKKHFEDIEKAAQDIAILWASNFAISINLIQHLLTSYSQLMSSKVSITETHHIHKKDMPSGTAISIARSINPHGILKKTGENNYMLDDIAISAHREGEITGIHTVDIDNDAESFNISHSSKTPDIYAQGAIDVAKWLYYKDKGLYKMAAYIESLT